MAKFALGLTLTLQPGRARENAEHLAQQATASEWQLILDLATAIVAVHESRNDGQIVHVAPISKDHLAAVVRNHRPL